MLQHLGWIPPILGLMSVQSFIYSIFCIIDVCIIINHRRQILLSEFLRFLKEPGRSSSIVGFLSAKTRSFNLTMKFDSREVARNALPSSTAPPMFLCVVRHRTKRCSCALQIPLSTHESSRYVVSIEHKRESRWQYDAHLCCPSVLLSCTAAFVPATQLLFYFTHTQQHRQHL